MNFIKFILSKTFVKQLLIAIIVLLVLVFLTTMWLRSTTNHGQQIEVPNLSKMSIEKVQEKLDELDLRFEVMDSANYNPSYPKHSVIEQVPKAGKMVKEDRKIYLALNPSGYAKIKVPNVLGITRRQAEPTLLASGFKIGKITERKDISDNVMEMKYKGKRLKPGTTLEKTAVIDLVVGDKSGSYITNTNEEEEKVDEQ